MNAWKLSPNETDWLKHSQTIDTNNWLAGWLDSKLGMAGQVARRPGGYMQCNEML